MSISETATEVVARVCGREFAGYGVIITDSPLMQRIPKRRAVTREKEERRLHDVAKQILEYLIDGGTVEVARGIAKDAGFADSIAITESHAQLVEAVTERFRTGDNAWSDGFKNDRVLSMMFWHDPSHRRVI